eukprot:GSMAST32.ASY1.ANO1.2288.1 assembled CDS
MNPAARIIQIADIMNRLGNRLGDKHFDLNQQFHNLVWMGDLNYRLESTKLRHLHDDYDTFRLDQKMGNAWVGFKEPKKADNFFPTYVHDEIEMIRVDWPRKVYRTLYKEPIYKGRSVKERCPGWCDRIIYSQLSFSDAKKDMYDPVVANDKTNMKYVYEAVHKVQGCDISDHAPVFGVYSLTSRMYIPVQVFNTTVVNDENCNDSELLSSLKNKSLDSITETKVLDTCYNECTTSPEIPPKIPKIPQGVELPFGRHVCFIIFFLQKSRIFFFFGKKILYLTNFFFFW